MLEHYLRLLVALLRAGSCASLSYFLLVCSTHSLRPSSLFGISHSTFAPLFYLCRIFIFPFHVLVGVRHNVFAEKKYHTVYQLLAYSSRPCDDGWTPSHSRLKPSPSLTTSNFFCFTFEVGKAYSSVTTSHFLTRKRSLT